MGYVDGIKPESTSINRWLHGSEIKSDKAYKDVFGRKASHFFNESEKHESPANDLKNKSKDYSEGMFYASRDLNEAYGKSLDNMITIEKNRQDQQSNHKKSQKL
jgi:hypothetical protein